MAVAYNDHYTLRHASAKLRADREVVLAAVAEDGLNLEHASAELQADRQVVQVAVQKTAGAIKFASTELLVGGAPERHPLLRPRHCPSSRRCRCRHHLGSSSSCCNSRERCATSCQASPWQ